MKILVVHQYYLFPGASGGSRFNELARLWSDAGHDVTVVAGTVDYATGQVPERYHGRWTTVEQDGPVRVIRCWVPPTYAKGYAGRAGVFAGFTASAATAVLQAPRPDVIVATSPPLLAVLPGMFAARRGGGVPWVFEMRDLWPESAITTGVLAAGSRIAQTLYAIERQAAKDADLINVLTPAFRDDLLRRGLATADKILFVPNGADVSRFSPGPADPAVRASFGWGDRFVVMYAGAHGRANALDQLVGAAERLRDRPDILIASVGDGPERARLADLVRQKDLKNLVFHGARPKDDMPAIVRACDVGAAVLQDNPTFRTVYPNKVFDYMACARPTLLGIDGVARQLVVDEAHAGVFVPPEDPAALAAAIRALADDPTRRAAMGASGHAWVHANATREALATRYLSALQVLATRGRHPRR